jgi:hypothetical protein
MTKMNIIEIEKKLRIFRRILKVGASHRALECKQLLSNLAWFYLTYSRSADNQGSNYHLILGFDM